MKRRALLALSGTAFTTLGGCTLRDEERGNIQIGNHTEQRVFLMLSIEQEGGLFSGDEEVYDDGSWQDPANGYRSTITDVAPPGNHHVEVEVRGTPTGPVETSATTQWTVDGSPSESLIVEIHPEQRIKFLTQ